MTMPPSDVDIATRKAQDAWCLGSTLMELHIIHLHTEHGLSFERIAERVGMSPEVVEATCIRSEEKTTT